MRTMEEKVKAVEGLLPVDLWNFIVVGLALFGVIVAVIKGIGIIRDEMKKHRDKKEMNKVGVTDEIANKVMEKLTPQIDSKFKEFSDSFDKKFDEIDKKLDNDKEMLTSHTTQLNDHEVRVGKLEGGNWSLCQGMLALIKRDPELKQAEHAMENYLITGRYEPKDWA